VVLAGWSAGSLCWHVGGPTDSVGDNLDPFTGGLAFLPYSNGVHDDLDDQPRRTAFRELVANGTLPAGYATEDGTGLVYAGPELLEAVTILPGRHAWHVTPGGGGYAERPIVPRLITAGEAGHGSPAVRSRHESRGGRQLAGLQHEEHEAQEAGLAPLP
jgi:peptidase S51-like protein